jgi:hypothetical protein
LIKQENVSPSFIGEWTIDVFIDGDLEGVCNACPRADFKVDETGTIRLSGSTQKFSWTQSDLGMTINNLDTAGIGATIRNGRYSFETKQFKDYIEFRLVRTGTSIDGYVLRRAQNEKGSTHLE